MFYLMNVECMSTLNICQFLILGLLQLAWAGELRRLSIGWSSQWLFCTRTYKQFSLYYSDYCKSCTCIIETGLPINLWKSNDIIKLVIYLRSLWILNLKCHLIQGPASIGTNYTYSRKRYILSIQAAVSGNRAVHDSQLNIPLYSLAYNVCSR